MADFNWCCNYACPSINHCKRFIKSKNPVKYMGLKGDDYHCLPPITRTLQPVLFNPKDTGNCDYYIRDDNADVFKNSGM